MHLQIDNFLQIWILGSKYWYWSRCDISFKKKTKFWWRNCGFTFTPEVKVYLLIDSPMVLCNQPTLLLRDYTDVKELAT